MAKKIEFSQVDLVLREVYRNYESFMDYFRRTGKDTITYGPLTISLFDLHYGLDELAPRKKEAFVYHVLLDMLQKDVGKIMGITTVSVGQYVKAAMLQLSERYFSDVDMEEVAKFMQFEKEKAERREIFTEKKKARQEKELAEWEAWLAANPPEEVPLEELREREEEDAAQ